MDPNLWKIEKGRVDDIINTSTLTSAGTLSGIQRNLASIDSSFNSGINALNTALARQDVTYNIVSNEANRLQQKKQSVDNAYDSTRRMVHLNNNYQKRYWDYTKIIMIWVGVLALYLIMNLLTQYVPVIPSILTDILVLIAVIVGAVYSFVIYNNLQNYDMMNYGQINPAAPVISEETAAKNKAALENAAAVASASGVSLPTNPKELTCLLNGLFYNTDATTGVTKCYKTCGTNPVLSTTFVGKCDTLGGNPIPVILTNEQFTNKNDIQANGEYEFTDYSVA
jgi:hypothetical protein